MPALNFQKQFAGAVERGEKRQTIRAPRKDGRDPKPGDTLYLYTGMRTKACRKLGEVVCSGVLRVRIGLGGPEGSSMDEAITFAQADGFRDWLAMRQWFERTHGLPFEGFLIQW